jgi:hypothetical protein
VSDTLGTANDALAFLLELAALVALAVWGFTTGPNLPARLLLGLGAPAVLAAVWGVWLAPASENRLPMPWLIVAKAVVLALVALALAAARHPRLAVAFAVLVALNLAVGVVLGRS